MNTKYIEMTGSPRSAGFKTKAIFLEYLEPFGFTQAKMTKRKNKVTILVTNDKNSQTAKMRMAKDLGVEIMTYFELAELFEI